MSTKRRVKQWKAVALGAIGLLFLCLFVGMIPLLAGAYRSFADEVGRTGLYSVELYSERTTLFYGYLCVELLFALGTAISAYCVIRCFFPVKVSADHARTRFRRWLRLFYVCLVVLILCIVVLFVYSRARGTYDDGIANGGEWTTAADLIIPGWIGIGSVVSMGAAVFSLIRWRELKCQYGLKQTMRKQKD